MITKMKKLTFLVYHKEYEAFLENIRDLGVIHVAERQHGTANTAELQENFRTSARLTSTLKQLQSIETDGSKDMAATEASVQRGYEVADEVDELLNEKNKLNQQLQSYTKDLSALEPWGDFDPDNVARLHDAGMNIGFYTCPERSYNPEWEELYHAMVISTIASKVYFITVTPQGDSIDIDAERIKLPRFSISQVQKSIDDTEMLISETEDKFKELAENDIPSIEAALNVLHGEIEFSQVVLNTESTAAEKLMMLEGWVPADKEADLSEYLDEQHVYYEIGNPVLGDNVPIQLKNKGMFSWFEPIVKLYMLPKYSELDLTPFFAPFFMIFFGLCLGDMGYGLFLLVLATGYRLFAKNMKPSMKSVVSLIQVLAVSTIVVGSLTGGFFGYNLYDLDWPVVQRLKNAVLLDNNDMFQLSLVLGVIQIMFGMILKVINQTIQFGFKYAIATLGWVILFLSIIFAVMLPSVLPFGSTAHLIIMGISALMIFLVNSPDKNIFVNIGLGFWDTYNMATGLLGDILSYVRLFALGLSGGILASVFNSLAAGLSPDNAIAGPIVFLLIFLIGHAINIFMNVLGALVHPMRLTFVEFFKNAGYDGGGTEYQPFRKIKD